MERFRPSSSSSIDRPLVRFPRGATSRLQPCYSTEPALRNRSISVHPMLRWSFATMIRLLSPVRLVCLVLALVALGGDAHAQHDSRGRIFWVTFMPNLGTGIQQSDMRLYVAADSP